MVVTNIMYNLLIVDDDPNILNGLCDIIKFEFPDTFECYTAIHGEEALELLHLYPIDIVITDMKMPKIDGIQLLSLIKKEDLCSNNSHVIVLSGYDDYLLVRDALKLGASDYLLKPINIDQLKHTILDIINILNISSEVDEKKASDNYNHQLILESILTGKKTTSEKVFKFITYNNIKDNTMCYRCYVDIKHGLRSTQLSIIQYLNQSIDAFKQKYCANHPNTPFVYLSGIIDGYWCLILFSYSQEPLSQFSFADFLNDLKNKTLKYYYPKKPIAFYELSLYKNEYIKGFDKYFFDFPHKHSSKNNCFNDKTTSVLLKMAADFFCQNNITGTMNLITTLFTKYNIEKFSPKQIKKELSNWIFLLMQMNSSFISVISQSTFTDHDILQHIDSSDRLSTLYKFIFEDLNYILEETNVKTKQEDDYIIKKSKKYIEEHFTENINIKDVASLFNLTPNYFSQLFQNKAGIPFRQFLRNYRIEKGKEYLSITHMKIYEIANSVGYTEPAHFTRAFKECTGYSPIDYRNEHRKL